MQTAAVSLMLVVSAIGFAGDWMSAMRSGNAALEAGQYRQAGAEFRSALASAKSPPERASALNNLASVEETLGNLAHAERHYEECIRIWSAMPDAPADALAKPLNNLALLYSRRREYDRAADLYRRSLELRPDARTQARVLTNLGRLSFARKRYAEAEAYYHRALTAVPDDTSTLANLAELQVTLRRTASARRAAERVLAAEQDRPLEIAARLSLASADAADKNWGSAERHLLRAMQLATGLLGENHAVTASVYGEYARVVRKLDRKREAADYEEKARRAAAASPESQTVSVSELLSDQRR